MNIYKTCPDVYNERFRLRLVTQEDCEDLLKFFSYIIEHLFISVNHHATNHRTLFFVYSGAVFAETS